MKIHLIRFYSNLCLKFLALEIAENFLNLIKIILRTYSKYYTTCRSSGFILFKIKVRQVCLLLSLEILAKEKKTKDKEIIRMKVRKGGRL